MSPMATRPSEMAIPAAALAALRQAITSEFGGDSAARVLRNAGHDAGDAFFHLLANDSDAEAGRAALSQIDADTFWRRFTQLFSSRGWGTLSHGLVHPGIAVLTASDWAEATAGSAPRPSCYFTTGLLANVLGKVAGSDVSVMEVECRSRGDASCRFLFGSPDALSSVYHMLLAGESPDSAVAQLV
ncbi:MAG TPA: V4R domain-containing protein [Longimicrobiales bacterium]